ncbi:MAG TPA: ABC transporter ATP-binding protein [Cryptosporangiaceae bacterium]|nr:ABC transporter ATP-binding protein [Cryptosporangiaceae bacterium]
MTGAETPAPTAELPVSTAELPVSTGELPVSTGGRRGAADLAPALEAIGITRSYAQGDTRVDALRGVDLAVARGDHVAIVGPSGSGKSTLMHLLGGLDRPTSGTLRIGGRDIAALSPDQLAEVRNTTVGFVFQSFHLLARTNALDNVALPLVYRGIGRAERRRRAAATLELVGLGHRLTHQPGQLSGGEQQRVAIARALVTEPQVLLADEPTGNLDSRRGAEVLDLLDTLNAERGVAVVVVTHDAAVAGRARRQVRVRDGLITADVLTSDVAGVLAADTADRAPAPDSGVPA